LIGKQKSQTWKERTIERGELQASNYRRKVGKIKKPEERKEVYWKRKGRSLQHSGGLQTHVFTLISVTLSLLAVELCYHHSFFFHFLFWGDFFLF